MRITLAYPTVYVTGLLLTFAGSVWGKWGLFLFSEKRVGGPHESGCCDQEIGLYCRKLGIEQRSSDYATRRKED